MKSDVAADFQLIEPVESRCSEAAIEKRRGIRYVFLRQQSVIWRILNQSKDRTTMRTNCRLLAALFCLVLGSAGVVRGEVVFGNLGSTGTAALSSTNTDFGPDDGTKALAQGFSTGSSSEFLTLQTITLGLFNDVVPALRSVSIYSNNAGSPGSSLFTSSSQSVTTTGKYSFTFSNSKLNANTTYWIVPEGPASWYINNDESQPTVQNGSGYGYVGTVRSTTGVGGPWVASTQPYSVSISAVPEPSAYALAALGLGVAGFVRARRRKPSV